MTDIVATLRAARIIFWDFDGVIKDSVEAKSDGFERLFAPFGADVARRVRLHHEANGGVSRFEKIPLYLTWAGQAVTPRRVSECCEQFGALVRQSVLASPWVGGVREYLAAHYSAQAFVLVTATPQQEMQEILVDLAIRDWFQDVHGAPASKVSSIRAGLVRWRCAAGDARMIGDTDADMDAAAMNGVPFVLRATSLNGELQARHTGPRFTQL